MMLLELHDDPETEEEDLLGNFSYVGQPEEETDEPAGKRSLC